MPSMVTDEDVCSLKSLHGTTISKSGQDVSSVAVPKSSCSLRVKASNCPISTGMTSQYN